MPSRTTTTRATLPLAARGAVAVVVLPLWAWDPGPQRRSVARCRVDLELALDLGQALAEAAQTGSQSAVGAANPVVADFDRERGLRRL